MLKQITCNLDNHEPYYAKVNPDSWNGDYVICPAFIHRCLGYLPTTICLTVSFTPIPHSHIGFVIIDAWGNVSHFVTKNNTIIHRHIFSELEDVIRTADSDNLLNEDTPTPLYVSITPLYSPPHS